MTKTTFILFFLINLTLAHAASLFEADPANFFIINSTATKFKKTPLKKDTKVRMIFFHTKWCPPCNQMEEDVFSTPEFIKKSKSFRLLELDADSQKSWPLRSKYKIGGYPSVVFTTPLGEEIYRIVGSRSLKEFIRLMDLTLTTNSVDAKADCLKDDVVSLWSCAIVCSERKEKLCAKAAFEKLLPKLEVGSAKYQIAKENLVASSENTDLKRMGYEALVKENPGSPEALVWALEYVQNHEPALEIQPSKEVIELVLKNYASMGAHPALDELGLSLTDLAQMRAQLLDQIGQTENAKKAWKEAVVLLDIVIKNQGAKSAKRGPTIEKIACLEAAGDYQAALELAVLYRQKFPNEFTFYLWEASILERQKKFPEALVASEKAFQYSYGDNRIRAAATQIQLLSTIPDKTRAKKIYDDVASEFPRGENMEPRTERYLKKLEDTWAKFPAAPAVK